MDGWDKKHKIVIDSTKVSGTSNLPDFPIVLTGNNFLSEIFSNTQSGGEDLRFSTDLAGTSEIPFEIVKWDTATPAAEVWVKIPTLSYDQDTVIFVHYGNSNASAYASSDTYGSENVWNTSYKAVYHLSNAKDSTSNGNNGTVNGATSGAAGQLGDAYNFDGNDDYISIPDSNSLDITAEITLSAWIKPESFSDNYPKVFGKEGGDPNSGYANYMFQASQGNDNLIFRITDTGNNNNDAAVLDPLSDYYGGMVLVHGVFTGSQMISYANGAEQASVSASITPQTSSGPAFMGSFPSALVSFYKGIIDEARIIAAALSSDWIVTEYNNQSSPSTFATAEIAITTISVPKAHLSASPYDSFFLPIIVPLAKTNLYTHNIRILPIVVPKAKLSASSHDPSISWAQHIPQAQINTGSKDPDLIATLEIPQTNISASSLSLLTSPFIIRVPLQSLSVDAHYPGLGWAQNIPLVSMSAEAVDSFTCASASIPKTVVCVHSLRPTYTWAADPSKVQVIYLFTLTGSADGESDITIPISSCQMRRRDGDPTYMSVVVPDYDAYSEAITARSNGQMVLKKGVRFSDGSIQVEEIARVDLEDIRLDKGPRNRSISLTGHRTVSTNDPNVVTLSGASYRNVTDGQRRFRCEVDLWLRPGDTAEIEGESFTVGFISYTIGKAEEVMEVVEAES